jgi:CRISPR/Cas system-associated exonuclease Cas4 (RecB family)
LPEESVAATLVFGAAIHRAIEHHFRELLAGNPPPTVESLVAEYRSGWDERQTAAIRFGKEEDEASLHGPAERMIRAFAGSELARTEHHIVAVEERLRGNIIPGIPDVVACVDLIVETPAELVITDWKTSRCRWNAEQVEEAAEQLLLYSELAGDYTPNKPIRLQFAVLTKTKEVAIDRHSVPVDRKRVARTKRVVERVWRAIEAEHFYPAPSPMNCCSCPFREPCNAWSS